MLSRGVIQPRQLSMIVETCTAYIRMGDHRRLKRFLRGNPRYYRQILFETSGELRKCVHVAIEQRNARLLRLLVDHCGAPLEARDARGLTPLYHAVSSHYVNGALFLLQRGASIHNAERSLSKASCLYSPFLHEVVKTGEERLVREVIQRGADINVLDWEEKDCLESIVSISPDVRSLIQSEMKEKQRQEKSELQDPPPVNYAQKTCSVEEGSMAGLRRMMQQLGAWLVTKGNYKYAFDCWKQSCQPHGSNIKGSVWADILHEDEERHLEKEKFSWNNRTLYNIIALLVMAKTSDPKAKNLTIPIQRLIDTLLLEGKETVAMDVMRRLTVLRFLRKDETVVLVRLLSNILCRLSRVSQISFAPLLDSAVVASKCLTFLTMDGSFSTDRNLATRHDLSKDFFHCSLCSAVLGLVLAVLRTTTIVNEHKVSATPDELSCFLRHITDFVCTFPWIRGHNLFHYIGKRCVLHRISPSSIKTLVTCSAGARGENRHENLPPHLSSDKDGNTPLHVFARCWSTEFLVEEGGLQCFLDHGAHLCIRNKRGQSVRDVLVKRGIFTEGELLPPLQCLAAAAFMKDANLKARVHRHPHLRIKQILLDH